MCNVLQDVEDIMLNQMTDVFQLSNWVATLVDTFGIRICDKQEWESFSKHYNQDMGEVTAYYPTHESTYNTNDSHMYKVDRDELTKACIELDSACTTIKNLSEAVVNFSHNKNMLAPIQDKEEYMP